MSNNQTASLQTFKQIMSENQKKIQISFYKIQSIVFRRTKTNFPGLFTIRLDNVGVAKYKTVKVWTSLRSRLEALINEYHESVSIKKKKCR